MALIDELKIIDGIFQGEHFIMRGINGYAVYNQYKADGLRSMARLIHDDEPFSLVIDSERSIQIPVEANKQIKKELNLIADELEGEREMQKIEIKFFETLNEQVYLSHTEDFTLISIPYWNWCFLWEKERDAEGTKIILRSSLISSRHNIDNVTAEQFSGELHQYLLGKGA